MTTDPLAPDAGGGRLQTQAKSAGADTDSLGDDDLKEMSLRLAHSIRNPLATIKSAVQLVKRLEMGPDKAARFLEACDWNASRAARRLGVERHWVRYRMALHGIERPRLRRTQSD